LNTALITSVQDAFGAEGMTRLLDARLARQRTDYALRIAPTAPLARKVEQLARIRAEEGYMAEVRRDGHDFLFIENHCPICAAATACQGFCATELELFRSALGPGVTVERAEHILSGDRRCAYRIRRNR
jgi:predicted ArsR family transcriptional regulator